MKKILLIILKWFLSLAVFLILLFILNKIFINMPLYYLVLDFINDNAMFLIIMSFMFMLTGIFYSLEKPFSFPAPLFNSIAAVMVTSFIIHMLLFMESILGISAINMISFIFPFIYAVVFIVVIITGYISLFSRKEKKKSKNK